MRPQGLARPCSILLACLVAGLLATAAPAAADELAGLTYAGCVGGPGNDGRCATTAAGLLRPAAVAITPDGRHLYATSPDRGTVEEFSVDPATGALAYLGCIQGAGRDAGCTATGNGLRDPVNLAVSPDGAFVYATSPQSDAVAVLHRDGTSGALRDAGCVKLPGSTEQCGATAPEIAGADGIAVSPDGHDVYVGAIASNAVTAFTRDAGSGALTARGCVQEDGTGGTCAAKGHGLYSPTSLAVSPDGANVYAGGPDTLAVLTRAASGDLSPAGCLQRPGPSRSCTASAPALSGRVVPAVTADGRDVFAVASQPGSLSGFRRGSGGALTTSGCVEETGGHTCDQSAPGLTGGSASAIAVAPDSGRVYVASQVSGAVGAFSRDAGTGRLAFAGCIDRDGGGGECAATAPGMGDPDALAVSPDGQTVYAASSGASTIAILTSRTAAAPAAAPARNRRRAHRARHGHRHHRHHRRGHR